MSPFFLCLLLSALPIHALADAKAENLLQLQKQPGFQDERAQARLLLKNREGKILAGRDLEFTRLESGARKIRLLSPPDLKGLTLLGKNNDLWIYLPSLKTTRRLVGSDRHASFLGSEFTYADLMEEPQDTQARWEKKEPCGDTLCDVIVSDKVVSRIRRDNHQFDQIVYQNARGQTTRTLQFSDYRQVAGKFLRPFRIRMTDEKTGKQSELQILDIKIPGHLTRADFSPQALENN